VWRLSAVVGALLDDVVRFTLASTVVVSLGLLLGFRPRGGFPGVLAATGWLQAFVSVDPIGHLVDGVRRLMHGQAEVVDVLLLLGWASALVAVLGPLSMRRYANRA
jgi:ABC-2 type transport system permease protein